MGKDQSSGKLSEASGVDRLLGREGHRPYFRLRLEELRVASSEFTRIKIRPVASLWERCFVASGLVPDGFSRRVVASNPRVFSLLATRVAVRSMVE